MGTIQEQNQEDRKYYRFRTSRFFDGTATADCVSCNLNCIFCWAYAKVNNPSKYGKFYSPTEVVNRLICIAEENGYNKVRISGNEPTLNKEHLLQVLSLIPSKYTAILESNGIIIGQDLAFAKELSKYNNLIVRIGFKGTSSKEFSCLTGADSDLYQYQFSALQNLFSNQVHVQPTLMMSFSTKKGINQFKKRIVSILPSYEEIAYDFLVLYKDVYKRLKDKGIQYHGYYWPWNQPNKSI